jgi:hypothetical protein
LSGRKPKSDGDGGGVNNNSDDKVLLEVEGELMEASVLKEIAFMHWEEGSSQDEAGSGGQEGKVGRLKTPVALII